MADTRRSPPTRPLDLEGILYEAQHRWLRPPEVCVVLRNYQKFQLTPEPPFKPPAGSLFLFDRKVLRYFRKDGHNWRKKKDGKTVKEAHEKLKDGSVDVVHCYYAHGEDNENFQRRCYWMLDGQLENIVLVHYRDVTEGSKPNSSQVSLGPELHAGRPFGSTAPGFELAKAPPCSSSPSKFDSVHEAGGLVPSVLAQPKYHPIPHNIFLPGHEVAGLSELSRNLPVQWSTLANCTGAGSVLSAEIPGSIRNADSSGGQFYSEKPSGMDLITDRLLIHARMGAERATHAPETSGEAVATEAVDQAETVGSQRIIQGIQDYGVGIVHAQSQNECASQMLKTSRVHPDSKSQDGRSDKDEFGELKKLDSFGRWMDKEIGGAYDDSFMASDSGNYWNALDSENDDKEVSSLSHHMQLDVDSMGPSLSQEQLFSIKDYSPDWAYSGTETKVLIVGSFLGNSKTSESTKWGCMFGEHEVAAEVLGNYAIRCTTPSHAPGRVPFYITCSNRLACSEIREFEYREIPSESLSLLTAKRSTEDEMRLQLRLTRLLKLEGDRKQPDCFLEECDKCKLIKAIRRTTSSMKWSDFQESSVTLADNSLKFKDIIIQHLLKDRLVEWLIYKVHEEGKGQHVLDDAGQGVIHLVAALGYVWAIGPILASGVSVNFRDTKGRTALHWASYFGREETVVELVRLGAAPGAVNDPTREYPGGKTASDLASSRGHKGIAGFLAEAELISHLSSLDIAAENDMDTAVQAVIQSDGVMDDEITLKGSLAAVRKSAHAAALIQAAFRNRSFRQKQINNNSDDLSEVSVDLATLGSFNKVPKVNHYEDYLHSAAMRIQQKYRGWKGRKEFLKIRNRIVKIQAHVRGHQVRKQYKKVVWSVSIVEKAILRWRRKGAGLRGFHAKQSSKDVAQDVSRTDEYEFLKIGQSQKSAGVEKALDRVKSMVRHPEARDQYMRLMTKTVNFKSADG